MPAAVINSRAVSGARLRHRSGRTDRDVIAYDDQVAGGTSAERGTTNGIVTAAWTTPVMIASMVRGLASRSLCMRDAGTVFFSLQGRACGCA
ncbi:hypothetical protein GCM10018779_33780 [Streptomyces griseocarneus]|nr:hypothetical protein GCM10018779_33780 [Streptomyces griseocarneus]